LEAIKFSKTGENKIKPKVAINEAVEMGKVFGGESSGKFVNGVLGTLYKKIAPEDDDKETDVEQSKAAE
jgi:N utilization substance protein B